MARLARTAKSTRSAVAALFACDIVHKDVLQVLLDSAKYPGFDPAAVRQLGEHR